MILLMPVQAEAVEALPEPPATLGRHEGREGRDYRRIPARPVHKGPIVACPTQPYGATGPLNRQAALGHQVGHDLSPLRGPQSYRDYEIMNERSSEWKNAARRRNIKWAIFRLSVERELEVFRLYEKEGVSCFPEFRPPM
jgi:hypothetical protein